MTPSQYKARLLVQDHGIPIPPIRGISVLLYVGKLASEEDNVVKRWVHQARRLSSINALRASVDRDDVRLKRKLRYDFAKLRTKCQLRFDPDRGAQKHPRRMGNHAGGVSRTPMSSQT